MFWRKNSLSLGSFLFMIDVVKDRQQIEDYLLNKSSEEVCQEIEKKLLDDEEFYEYFQTVEGDLYEKYLEGDYSRNEKEAFEQYFLAHPQRQEDLWLTKALKEKALQNKPVQAIAKEEKESAWSFDIRKLFPILIPGFGVLIIALGVFIWWNSQNSDLNKGLAALNDAYKTERPLQSRVSDFEYSNFVQKRGNEEKFSDNLRIAETFLLQAVKTKPNADSYHALGKFYLASKQFERAVENLNNALKFAEKNPKINNDLGVAWLEKGKLLLVEDKGKAAISFAESLKYLNQAISINNNSPEALFNRAETYQNLYLPEKAAEDLQNYLKQDPNSRWADEARERLKILEEQKAKVSLTEDQIIENFKIAYQNKETNQAWQMIKLARSRTGNFILQKFITDFLNDPPNEENSLAMMKFAAEVEKKTVGDFFSTDLVNYYSKTTASQQTTLRQAQAVMKEAYAQYQKSEYQTSADKYAEAKKIFTDAGNTPEALFAEVWISFSKLRIPKNEGKDEISAFSKLEKTFEAKKYLSLQSQVFDGLGDTLESSGNSSESIKARQNAITLAKQIQDSETIFRLYYGLSDTYLTLRKFQKSLENSFLAFEVQNDFQPKPNVLWTPYFIAAQSIYLDGFTDVAFAYQEKISFLAEQTNIPLLKSRSSEQFALFYLLNNDLENAIEFGKKSIAFSKAVKDQSTQLDLISKVSLLLGDIYRKMGNHEAALNAYQQSQEIYQKIDFKVQLYQVFRGKALSYMELNQNDLALRELESSISHYEIFRRKIYEESNRNSFFDIEQGIYDVAIEFASSKLNDDIKAINYAETSKARNLLDFLQTDNLTVQEKATPDISLKSMTVPKDVVSLQEKIPDDAQILEFSLLEDKVIAWIVTKESVKSTTTSFQIDTLRRKIKDYLDKLNSNDDSAESEFKQLSKELHQILIAPNESLLDATKTLYIVPDKELHFFPFSSLINPENEKYLIEKYTIGISPSLNVLVLNLRNSKERAKNFDENLLVVGNPLFSKVKYPTLDSLPSASREATKISELYQSKKVLLDEKATKSNIVEMMKESEIIHFASHAVMNENSPMLSGLILADVGLDNQDMLKAYEIYQNRLPKTKLVILSACQTGIEIAFRGEGAISLARPFIANGVPLVIASLWKAESEPTAELMINFHRFRKVNKFSALKSLQQAQIALIKGNNKFFQKPKSWASFIAIGSD